VSIERPFVPFPLTIVLSVLLRYTDILITPLVSSNSSYIELRHLCRLKYQNIAKRINVSLKMYHLRNTQNAICSWLNSEQTIFDECDFSYI
jgi:hypothetical protein